jgi:hypothetical protein
MKTALLNRIVRGVTTRSRRAPLPYTGSPGILSPAQGQAAFNTVARPWSGKCTA